MPTEIRELTEAIERRTAAKDRLVRDLQGVTAGIDALTASVERLTKRLREVNDETHDKPHRLDA